MGVARADHAAVASKRPDREKFRVTMIAKIEHARKTGRGELQLRPEAIHVMAAQQIVDAACDSAVAHLARRHEPKQCPSRLGRGTSAPLHAPGSRVLSCPRSRPNRRLRSA